MAGRHRGYDPTKDRLGYGPMLFRLAVRRLDSKNCVLPNGDVKEHPDLDAPEQEALCQAASFDRPGSRSARGYLMSHLLDLARM